MIICFICFLKVLIIYCCIVVVILLCINVILKWVIKKIKSFIIWIVEVIIVFLGIRRIKIICDDVRFRVFVGFFFWNFCVVFFC